MPLREILCLECGHQFEEILKLEDRCPGCRQCESSKTEFLITAPGGYQGNLGPGSTKPRGAGSFKRPKVKIV